MPIRRLSFDRKIQTTSFGSEVPCSSHKFHRDYRLETKLRAGAMQRLASRVGQVLHLVEFASEYVSRVCLYADSTELLRISGIPVNRSAAIPGGTRKHLKPSV